jgi:curved DNA-binding protein
VEDIKRAYRKLARKYHPDVSQVTDAESRFKEINEAWEVLQDPKKRAHYDKIRKGGFESMRGHDASSTKNEYSEDFSDFFNSIFGQAGKGAPFSSRHRGRDYHTDLAIPLRLAYQGGTYTFSLPLNGENRHLQVNIPKGITSGSQIRLKGQGESLGKEGSAGDLYVTIHFQKDPLFSVHHKDIYLKLPITPWEAALGATISVPTLGGAVNLKIPPNAYSDQKLRLKERGLPGQPSGDQYVILKIAIPPVTHPDMAKLYEEMAQKIPFNPREKWGNANA